jgi:hypothetical protein
MALVSSPLPASFSSLLEQPVRRSQRTAVRYTFEEIETMVAQVAPAVLALLSDGVPRTKRAVVLALAGQHPKQDVVRTLIRLAVTDRVAVDGGRYRLPPPAKASL